MTTEKPPSAYARAEAGSRQFVLQVGLGVVAFILGSILSVGAAARIGERLGSMEHGWAIFAFRFVFERLWLLAVLPLFGYVIGRFTDISPSGFALTAGLSGETFSVLLVTAINGFEYLLGDTAGLAVRGVSLFLGMVITARLVMVGRVANAEGQVAANVIAAQRKAEYAAFLAAAEGKSDPQSDHTIAPLPDPLPASQGEGEKKS